MCGQGQRLEVGLDSWSRLCTESPRARLAQGCVYLGHGSRRPPFKLITLCPGEQYGNWSGLWRESTLTHTRRLTPSLQPGAQCCRRRPGSRGCRSFLAGGRPAPGAASAESPPASPVRLPEPQKLPGCRHPPRSAPGKQEAEAVTPPGEEKDAEKESQRVQAPCRPHPVGVPRRWSPVRAAPRASRPAPPARGGRTPAAPPGLRLRETGDRVGQGARLPTPPQSRNSAPGAAGPPLPTLAPQAPTPGVSMTRLSWCFSCVIRWGKYLFSCLLPLRFCLRSQVKGLGNTWPLPTPRPLPPSRFPPAVSWAFDLTYYPPLSGTLRLGRRQPGSQQSLGLRGSRHPDCWDPGRGVAAPPPAHTPECLGLGSEV